MNVSGDYLIQSLEEYREIWWLSWLHDLQYEMTLKLCLWSLILWSLNTGDYWEFCRPNNSQVLHQLVLLSKAGILYLVSLLSLEDPLSHVMIQIKIWLPIITQIFLLLLISMSLSNSTFNGKPASNSFCTIFWHHGSYAKAQKQLRQYTKQRLGKHSIWLNINFLCKYWCNAFL